MAFIDSEKAFDRVPWEVVSWALRYLGVDEWIVSVMKAMYEDATTKVWVNEREKKKERERLPVLEWRCIWDLTSPHCYSLCWRLV